MKINKHLEQSLKDALAGRDITAHFAIFMECLPEWLAPEIAESGVSYNRLHGVRLVLGLLKEWMEARAVDDEEKKLIFSTLLTLISEMQDEAVTVFHQIKQEEESLRHQNTNRNTFEISLGWGEEWYVAYTDTGLQSNTYRACNHSIAYEKALMVKPSNSEISRIEFNGQVIDTQ